MKMMEKNKGKLGKSLFWAIFITIFFYGVLCAQGLQERLDYLRGLQRQALQSESEGKYDEAIELARKIHDESEDITAIIKVLERWNVLKNRVALAKQVHAEKYAPKEYDLAVGYYNSSHQLMNKKELSDASLDIEKGIKHADAAIEKSRQLYLDEVNKNQKDKKKALKGKIVISSEKDSYEVRLIPSRRDCLWNIAGYDFIYNNPRMWTRIYEANRDKIKDPDLIYPGQILKIIPIDVPLTKTP